MSQPSAHFDTDPLNWLYVLHNAGWAKSCLQVLREIFRFCASGFVVEHAAAWHFEAVLRGRCRT